MMKLLAKKTNWDFMKWRKLSIALSALLIIGSFVSFATKGLVLGLDFTGGVLIEVEYPEPVKLKNIRDTLSGAGYEGAIVQFFGSEQEITIRLQIEEGVSENEVREKVEILLKKDNPAVEIKRVGTVGSAVGEELAEDGGKAMFIAIICIMLYIAVRFEWKFSLGSVAALVHDVIITMGFFSVAGIEFDLTILAALLAVIGYSLNDTIVVFDRIRENFRMMRNRTPVEVINTSLNQTLARTLMTSITTLLVLLSLFFLGGPMIHGFSLALILGVVIGTYSSIYVASTAALALGITKEDLMVVEVEKEGADQENISDYL